MTSIITILIGAVGGFVISHFLLKRQRRKKIEALEALEASYPLEAPTECPKCGNSEATRKPLKGLPTGYKGPPIFHKPYHHPRLVSINSPERLSHKCWQCGFEVRTTARNPS